MRKWRIEDSEELYNITGWGRTLVLMTRVMLLLHLVETGCLSI